MGPIWAGVVTAIGSYLFLQLALVALGIGILHGIVMWFAALVALLLFLPWAAVWRWARSTPATPSPFIETTRVRRD